MIFGMDTTTLAVMAILFVICCSLALISAKGPPLVKYPLNVLMGAGFGLAYVGYLPIHFGPRIDMVIAAAIGAIGFLLLMRTRA